jgi:spore coat polysaccharide biosynthesis protein SpsF
MTRTVAIVQARTGSTRLPGKILLPLLGTPVLAHVVDRLRCAQLLDDVVVATTVLPGDDAVAELAAANGWPVTRGSEDDLVSRYLDAAHAHSADRIVRITSDCPLIDPDLVDDVVRALGPRVDYTSNSLAPRTTPRGLDAEACTIEALERVDREDHDPASREHATPYLYRNPDVFRIVRVDLERDWSEHRWTLDTPEDYELLTRIFEGIGRPDFGWREVLAIVEAHPEWSELNRHVRQKTVHLS